MGTKLSDEEFWLLLQLMQRYAETDLDQWDRLQLRTAHGPVYVRITRELPADEPEHAYRPALVPLSARYRTGRAAPTGPVPPPSTSPPQPPPPP